MIPVNQIESHSPDESSRLAGLAGLVGALLFFAGDMLFYGHFGAGASFHDGMQRVVRDASMARLFTGGLLGPVAACLCIIGFWHARAHRRAGKQSDGEDNHKKR